MGVDQSKVESSESGSSGSSGQKPPSEIQLVLGSVVQQGRALATPEKPKPKEPPPTTSIVTVVSGEKGGGEKEEDDERAILKEIPLFLPLVPSSINRNSVFSSTDYSVLAQIQPDPWIALAGRIQHRFKRCGAVVTQEQNSITIRMRQLETRLSKSLVSVAHISNELRTMEGHFKEIEGLAGALARATSSLQVVNARLQRLYNAIPVNFSAEAQLEDPAQQINHRRLVSPNCGYRPFPFLRYVSGVAFTKGRRPTMEDTHFVCDDVRSLIMKRARFLGITGDILEGLPPIGLFCVYDGHGGSKVAEYSAELLHIMLLDQILSSFDLVRDYSKVFDPDEDEKEGKGEEEGEEQEQQKQEQEQQNQQQEQSQQEQQQQQEQQEEQQQQPQQNGEQQNEKQEEQNKGGEGEKHSPDHTTKKEEEKGKRKGEEVLLSEEKETNGKGEKKSEASKEKETQGNDLKNKGEVLSEEKEREGNGSSSSPSPSPSPSSSSSSPSSSPSSSSPLSSPSPRATSSPQAASYSSSAPFTSSPSKPKPHRQQPQQQQQEEEEEKEEESAENTSPQTEEEDTKRKQKRLKTHIFSSLSSVFENFDRFMLQRAEKEGWDGGATAVVCLTIWDSLFVANVGDAEAVVGTLRHNRPDHDGFRSVLVTEKHQPSSSDSRHKKVADREKRRIRKAGGRVLHGRVMGALAVSRALGDKSFKMPLNDGRGDFVTASPFLHFEKFSNSDFLICACDGFWDTFNYQDAVDLAQEKRKLGLSPELISKLLVSEALERGSMDNISLVVSWGL